MKFWLKSFDLENGSIQPSLNCSLILHRLRLLFHRICIYALILLVSALGSYDKHAVTWFLINNGIQGMVKYNAFNMKLNIIQWFPRFSLSMQKKGVPEIQEVSSTQFSYEWFGLDFTGVGLASLARRACVPADSATLLQPAKVCESCIKFTGRNLLFHN